MAKIKRAILPLFIILFIVVALTKNSFGVNTGKAIVEAKLKKSMDDTSITLEIIPKNDEFEILEDEGEWYRVNYQKIKGYVKKEQVVEITNEESNNDENGENANLTNENSQKVTDKEKDLNLENTLEEENNKQENLEQINVGSKVYTNTEIQVYLRPLLNSMKIETLNKNQEVTVIDTTNKWVYISVDGKTGWIRKEFLSNEKINETSTNTSKDNDTSKYLNKTAYISSDGVNFREEPNTDSKILKTLLQNAKLTILLEEGNWYKVKYNDLEGYVLKTYVSEEKVTTVTSRSSSSRKETTAQVVTVADVSIDTQIDEETIETETTVELTNEVEKTTTTTSTSSSSKATQLVELAKKYVGCSYVYGGSTPSGFDCSGFTMYLYKQFGVSLPHSATAQSSKGTKVEMENLQPGDIIFFTNYKTNTGIGHCGIYIGNNQFIHASTEKTGVITSSLSSSAYQKRFVTAVRIF